jgi:DNA-binding response OmpR family regulator
MAEILVIDDMDGMRHLVASVLGRAGHTVFQATDGEAAIEFLRQRRFDLVVTDLVMPKADGADVLVFLRDRPDRPPVIAMSGGDRSLAPDRALLLARVLADATLSKPFEPKELVATVARLLKKSG